MVEYAHEYELLQEISEGQGGGGDGGEVDICADQGTGELLDVSKGAYMAGRRTGVLHLQVTHPKPQGEVCPATTVILIKPDNRQFGDSLGKHMK